MSCHRKKPPAQFTQLNALFIADLYKMIVKPEVESRKLHTKDFCMIISLDLFKIEQMYIACMNQAKDLAIIYGRSFNIIPVVFLSILRKMVKRGGKTYFGTHELYQRIREYRTEKRLL